MEKSWNDLQAQADRCIAMLHTRNDGGWRTAQQIRQIASRTRAKRGISLFEKDRNKKFPWNPAKFESPTRVKRLMWWQNEDGTMKTFAKKEKPPEKERKAMNAEERKTFEKKLNDLCRHETIMKLLADIAKDMTICKLCGWDATEYPRMLKAEIENVLTLNNKQHDTIRM